MIADPGKNYRWEFKKKSGVWRELHKLELVLLIFFVVGLLVWVKVLDVKRNYSELHHRVNQLEFMHKGAHGE